MKKLSMIVSAAALAVAAFAAPAHASTVDLGVVGNATQNVRDGVTNQDAWAVDINVGNVATSNIDMSASNLVNTISNDTMISQVDAVPSLLNGALVLNDSLNRSLGAVTQVAVAGIGSGAVTGSNLTGNALNSANLAANSVTIKQ